LLNDPTYVEAARALAARVMKEEPGDAPARLERAFRLVLSRAPRAREVAMLLGLWNEHHSQYAADPSSARALLGVGDLPMPPELDQAELAAWTSVTRVLLNLHETINRS
jgi:hypothetical protein